MKKTITTALLHLLMLISPIQGQITGLTCSPHGNLLAMGVKNRDQRMKLQIYDRLTQKISTMPITATYCGIDTIKNITFSHDETYIAIQTSISSLIYYDLKNNSFSSLQPKYHVKDFCFDINNNLLILARKYNQDLLLTFDPVHHKTVKKIYLNLNGREATQLCYLKKHNLVYVGFVFGNKLCKVSLTKKQHELIDIKYPDGPTGTTVLYSYNEKDDHFVTHTLQGFYTFTSKQLNFVSKSTLLIINNPTAFRLWIVTSNRIFYLDNNRTIYWHSNKPDPLHLHSLTFDVENDEIISLTGQTIYEKDQLFFATKKGSIYRLDPSMKKYEKIFDIVN